MLLSGRGSLYSLTSSKSVIMGDLLPVSEKKWNPSSNGILNGPHRSLHVRSKTLVLLLLVLSGNEGLTPFSLIPLLDLPVLLASFGGYLDTSSKVLVP